MTNPDFIVEKPAENPKFQLETLGSLFGNG